MLTNFEMKDKKIHIDNLPKQNPFQLPENYFENLAARTIERAISQEVSILDSIEKQNIFKVPEGYFEELGNKIDAKIAKPIEKKSWFTINRKAVWRAAAVLVASVGIGSYYYSNQNSTETAINNLSNEEIVAYLDTQSSANVDYTSAISVAESDSLMLNQIDLDKESIMKLLETENIEDI